VDEKRGRPPPFFSLFFNYSFVPPVRSRGSIDKYWHTNCVPIETMKSNLPRYNLTRRRSVADHCYAEAGRGEGNDWAEGGRSRSVPVDAVQATQSSASVHRAGKLPREKQRTRLGRSTASGPHCEVEDDISNEECYIMKSAFKISPLGGVSSGDVPFPWLRIWAHRGACS